MFTDMLGYTALTQRNQALGDFHEPNVIRVAPTPPYDTFHEVWRFAPILKQHE